VDGVPILIVEERSVFRLAQFTQRQCTTIPPKSFRSRVVAALPSITLATGGPKHRKMLVDRLNSRHGKKTVLVVGSGDGGFAPEALAGIADAEIVYTDVSLEAGGIQLICDAHDIPFETDSFDAVIAQAVLEHVADPYRRVEEFHRVLKPNGLVYAETPFMQQGHAEPYDFTRFTANGHRRLFRRFASISCGTTGGPATALAWAWQYFLLACSNDSRPMNALALVVGRTTGGLLKYVDYWLYGRPNSVSGASGFCFLGSKSDKSLSDYDIIASSKPKRSAG
jgi:SAM-dependent methyltransferase